jgi:cellulose 1,4-beta-cellobiosidase
VSRIDNGIRYQKTNFDSRLYVVDPKGTRHYPFKLLNRRIEFDINLSNAPCGYCSAIYFSAMKFGAIGKEYCDAQGTCAEYDILEANRAALSQASHSCSVNCPDPNSNCNAVCDKWGCSVNSRRFPGVPVGLNKNIDTMKPIRVSTTFRTDNNRDDGTLIAIEQVYFQEGRKYQLPTISDQYCLGLGSANPQFPTTGRLRGMSEAMKNGMTLVMSLWQQPDMSWLDGGSTNPDCKVPSSGPAQYSLTNLTIFYA